MCQSISPIDRKTTVPQPERALEEKHSNWMSSEQFKNTHIRTQTHSRQAKMSILNFGKRNIGQSRKWETEQEKKKS